MSALNDVEAACFIGSLAEVDEERLCGCDQAAPLRRAASDLFDYWTEAIFATDLVLLDRSFGFERIQQASNRRLW